MTDRRRVDTPNKGYSAVDKAGKDMQQDRQIKELHDEVRTSADENLKQHNDIRELFHNGEVRFVKAFEGLEQKVATQRQIAVVAWIIIVSLGGLLMNAHLNRLDDIARTVEKTGDVVQTIDKRQEAWEKFATGWGNGLEKKDAELEADIRENSQDIKQLRREVRQ